MLAYMCGARRPLPPPNIRSGAHASPLPHGMVWHSCVNKSTCCYGLIVFREAWVALSGKNATRMLDCLWFVVPPLPAYANHLVGRTGFC